MLRWSTLRTRFPFPYNVYLIAAAVLGHFVLLNAHLAALTNDIFQVASASQRSCTSYSFSTQSKLMLLYYTFFLLGLAAAIDKFLSPTFIEHFPNQDAFLASNDISSLEKLSRHYECNVKSALPPLILRNSYYRLGSMNAEALLLRTRDPRPSREDENELIQGYKKTYYDYRDCSRTLVPIANLMALAAIVLTLSIAAGTLFTISCVAYQWARGGGY